MEAHEKMNRLDFGSRGMFETSISLKQHPYNRNMNGRSTKRSFVTAI
jgi:hypothetical protein